MGKYRLLRELGRGGMGIVYLAEDTRLRRQVALKFLHTTLTLDGSFISRFTSEAQAIAGLTHAGIVRIHAFEEIDGTHLIDMEYVEGQSLDSVIAQGPVDQSMALEIIGHVLQALAACHSIGLVHRDIKPSNVLVARDGRVLLSDFGLALSCDYAMASTSSSSSFIGTPKYAPPESWEKITPTPASDVYSAGVLLLELLAGRTPFDGDSPLAIMRKMVASEAISVREHLPDLSIELDALLQDMLRIEVARRPTDGGEAFRRLRETPEFKTVLDASGNTLQIVPPSSTRRPPKVSIVSPLRIAIATIIILVLAAWTYWQQEPGLVTEPTQDETAAAERPVVVSNGSPDVAHVFIGGKHVFFSAYAGDWRTLWSYTVATGETTPIWPELGLDPEDTLFQDGGFPVAHGVVGVVRSETDGIRLFCSDGTPEGTNVLAYAADVRANRIRLLAAHGGKAYFNRIGGDETFGLWETDGSMEGTRHLWGDERAPLVSELEISPSGGLYFASQTNGSLYHWPKGTDSPYSLWPDSYVHNSLSTITLIDDRVLVSADRVDSTSGLELWIAQNSPGSMRLLYELIPGGVSGLPNPEFAHFRNGVVFRAQTLEHGDEPWFTDGTKEGTYLIHDVNPGVMDSKAYRFTESGGLLYFSALTATEGQELWVSDGTTESTRRLTDNRPGLESTDPYAFCAFRGGLLFTPHDPETGEELWFTDGTPEGTRLLKDCMPGPESGSPHGTAVVAGDRAIFAATHPEYGRVLWETDGTPEGTRPLFTTLEAERAPTLPAVPWTSFRGQVLLVNTSPTHGAELWIMDPKTTESRLVKDIFPGPNGSNPHDFIALDDYVYFAATDGIHGTEIWRTDGTPEQTSLAFDCRPGPESSDPANFVHWNPGRWAFTALGDSKLGYGIFYYDSGSRSFRSPFGATSLDPTWRPSDLTDSGEGWLLFSTQNASGETLFWRTNGNETQRLPILGQAR